MEVLHSYVVRLYREDVDGMAGVVESVETGRTARFRSADELWCALRDAGLRARWQSINPERKEET